MSYDQSDADREAGMDATYQMVWDDPATRELFYEELYEEIVRDFKDDRLRSFFLDEPKVVTPAVGALETARSLLPQHDTAAFIFGAIATEVGLRLAFIRPIAHSLVHTASVVAWITRMSLGRDERFMKILLDLLVAQGGTDPRTHHRPGSKMTLWAEVIIVREKRNRVLHDAEVATHEDAELAIDVAGCILEELFPALINKLGLQLQGTRVCA